MKPIDYSALTQTVKRIRIWYALLIVIIVIFGIRLFYVQVIRYSHYHEAALADQLKEYQIPATRGVIEAYQNDTVVPIVLNQTLYTLYVDPTLVKNPAKTAADIAGVIGGNANQYKQAIKTPDTRYVILAEKIKTGQSNKILSYKLPGVGTQPQDYRIYPDGSLASQVLGFVNDNGNGEYGIEQALNSQLAGKPGMLKAITDANGVPLVASGKNVDISPTPGNNVVLTLDMGMQSQLETILAKEYQATHSQGLSAIIMDPNTGQIKAMANYPTYNPSNYSSVSNEALFENTAVASQLEIGSIMKVLTIAAGLNQGVIQPNTTYYDSGSATIDGTTITNVLPLPSHTVSIQDILTLSLNTGAIHVLGQMGGGQIDQQARDTWYNYMTKHYRFGQATGIEQSYEASGFVPNPDVGNGLNLEYADTAFGQGISMTMLQMLSAFASVINGGTYYQPHLVDGIIGTSGQEQYKPAKVEERNVVKPQVSSDIQQLMEGVFNNNHALYQSALFPNFNIGGKTGTAQIAIPGGYSPNQYNGTFLGFVGGDKPQYVIDILDQSPNLPSYDYAGTEAAAPIFSQIAQMLIDSGQVTPKT